MGIRIRKGSSVMAFVVLALGVTGATGHWDDLFLWVDRNLGYVWWFVGTRVGGLCLVLVGLFFAVDAVWGVRRLAGASSPEDYEAVIAEKDASIAGLRQEIETRFRSPESTTRRAVEALALLRDEASAMEHGACDAERAEALAARVRGVFNGLFIERTAVKELDTFLRDRYATDKNPKWLAADLRQKLDAWKNLLPKMTLNPLFEWDDPRASQ
jgi:hypothetical protein